MMQAPSEASQITGSSNDTAGTILEARDIAGTIPEARYTTVIGMSITTGVRFSKPAKLFGPISGATVC